MLEITIRGDEYYDEEQELFLTRGDTTLRFEHSLVTLSKWESELGKPFLSAQEKDSEEVLRYVQIMLLDDVDPTEVYKLSGDHFTEIAQYINSKQTATWFSENDSKSRSSQTITAELIYYWMVALNIPFECQYWHLSRLLTLIKICNEKNSPPKKMSAAEIAAQNRELNAQRRAAMGTSG